MTKTEFHIVIDKQFHHADQQETHSNALWNHISNLQECLRVFAYPRRGTWEERMTFEQLLKYAQDKFTSEELQS